MINKIGDKWRDKKGFNEGDKEEYREDKISPIGNEISCVMYGIKSEDLSNNSKLENLLLEAAKQDSFKVLEKINHSFEPQGYTSVLLIQESHIAVHTYPEYGSLFFYLYSCRSRHDGRKTYQYFKDSLNPSSIDFKERDIVVEDKSPVSC